jgi:hypothetical protein
MRSIGVTFPDEKKNRNRFEATRGSRPAANASAQAAQSNPDESDEVRRLETLLKDIPI